MRPYEGSAWLDLTHRWASATVPARRADQRSEGRSRRADEARATRHDTHRGAQVRQRVSMRPTRLAAMVLHMCASRLMLVSADSLSSLALLCLHVAAPPPIASSHAAVRSRIRRARTSLFVPTRW